MPSPLVSCQLQLDAYGCQVDWFHVLSLLNRIWLMPDIWSVAFTVTVTSVEFVYVAPLLIWIEPSGGVLSSLIPVKVTCESSIRPGP